MAPAVKLTYFDVQGKGELIRLILLLGKVGFYGQNVKMFPSSLSERIVTEMLASFCVS